jgi:hypothetical protein
LLTTRTERWKHGKGIVRSCYDNTVTISRWRFGEYNGNRDGYTEPREGALFATRKVLALYVVGVINYNISVSLPDILMFIAASVDFEAVSTKIMNNSIGSGS